MKKTLPVALAVGVLALVGCSGGTETNKAQASQEETIEPIADYTGPSTESQNNLPCFTVGDVGSRLSMTWELVVAARDASDQPDYIDDLMDEGDDLWDDIEDDTTCEGGTELADFNYEVANLNIDVTLDQDTDEQYEKIADLGNALLDLSDDEGHEWSYEFVSDVSEID